MIRLTEEMRTAIDSALADGAPIAVATVDAEGQPLETRLSGGIAIAAGFKARRPALQVDPCRDGQPGWVAHLDDQLPFQTVGQRTERANYLNQAYASQKSKPEPAPCGLSRHRGAPRPLGTSSITAVPPARKIWLPQWLVPRGRYHGVPRRRLSRNA